MATSIKQGVVNASLIPRKLGACSRQNSLAIALREISRIERTLFMLQSRMPGQRSAAATLDLVTD
jgi:TnpA family transposase